MSSTKAYVFWDNSNIFLSARQMAGEKDGFGAERAVRLQFENLFKLAAAGRDVGKAWCAGSITRDFQSVWERFSARTGILPEIFETGRISGKEQGVDQCLQVWMLRCLADVRPPQVAVLLTGDGRGYEDGAGFHADLERMHKAGWGIEVLSWDSACNARLKAWAREAGVYVPLENYYESITFIEGARVSKPVNLKHRPRATPRTEPGPVSHDPPTLPAI